MIKDTADAKWDRVKGKVQQKWDKLTYEDMINIQGRKHHLLGMLRIRYGFTPEQANRELGAFIADSSRAFAAAAAKKEELAVPATTK